jgi:hypothetical protein
MSLSRVFALEGIIIILSLRKYQTLSASYVTISKYLIIRTKTADSYNIVTMLFV